MNWLDQLARKCAPTTAIVGGLVWIAYTLAALLQPWGNYATFVDQSGAVSNPSSFAFQLTALLGGAALLLLGAALAGAIRRGAGAGRRRRRTGDVDRCTAPAD
jgi:hypothetical protein